MRFAAMNPNLNVELNFFFGKPRSIYYKMGNRKL